MPGSVFLEGERLNLRTVEGDDYGLLVRHYNNPNVRRQFGDIRLPFSADDLAVFYEEREETIHQFLPSQDGTPVGHVFLRRVDLEARNGELGYMVFPDHQGNGYATDASELCLDHAFNGLGLHKVWARVSDGNEASVRVLEKLGFTREGVLREQFYGFGDFVDEYRFGLLRSEW